MLDTFGADATRYWALSGQLGKDMAFDEVELKNGQKLVTKLRNACNFVKMQLEDFDPTVTIEKPTLYGTDTWILARLDETIEKMRKNLDAYEIGLAKIHFEEFFWRDFCDTYLEMVKTRVYQPERFVDGQAKRLSGQWTLYHVMYTIIRLLAPYIPHVTEEIYQGYFKQYVGEVSLHRLSFPTPFLAVDGYVVDSFSSVLQVVADVRKYKTEKQISLGAEIESLTLQLPPEQLAMLQSVEDDIV